MNVELVINIKILEDMHTKAVMKKDSKTAKVAMEKLEVLYAQQWGLPKIIINEVI